MQRKHRLCSRLSTFLNLDFHLITFEMVNSLKPKNFNEQFHKTRVMMFGRWQV